MRFRLCKPCCGITCLISDGDLDGHECNTDFTRDDIDWPAPNHSTTNDDQIWRDTTPQRAGVPWKVSVVPRIEVTETGGKRYGHVELLLIGGMVDCDDYAFLRFTAHRPDATSLSYISLELGLMIAGVEQIIALHVLNNQDCFDKTNVALTVCMDGDWGLIEGTELVEWTEVTPPGGMELCWDGETLTGSIPYWSGAGQSLPEQANDGWLRVAAHKDAGGTSLATALIRRGIYAGFGTGTLSTEIDKVTFTEFDFRHYEVDDVDDLPCGDCLPHCCGSPVPSEVILEIASVATGPSTGLACDLECGDANGTFYIPAQIGGEATNGVDTCGGPCEGDGSCSWWYFADGTDMDCSGSPSPSYILIYAVITEVGNTAGVPYRKIQFLVTIGDSDTATFVSFQTTPYSLTTACDTWTDWIDLTLTGGTGCDITSATVRFKMVP